MRKFHRTSTNAVIRKHGPFFDLLSKSDRKVMIHTALRLAGGAWMVNYVPLRFTNYAYALGYRVTDRWKKFKRRVLGGGNVATPLIGVTPPGGGPTVISSKGKIFKSKNRYNGQKMAIAIQNGANVKVKGTSAGGDIHVALPYGHPLNRTTADALRKVPAHEVQFVIDEAAKQIASLINTARPVPRSRLGKVTIKGASSGIRSRVIGLAG